MAGAQVARARAVIPPPYGLMFHHFHGGAHPRVQGSVSADEFELIVQWHRPMVADPAWWLDAADRHRLPTLYMLALTFDDGLRSQFDVAKPILDQYGLKAFWFVPTLPLTGKPLWLEIDRWTRTVAAPSLPDFYEDFFTAVGRHAEMPEGYLADLPYLSAVDRLFRWYRNHVLPERVYREVMDTLRAEYDPNATPAWLASKLWLTPGELAQLVKEGHHVGLHSHTHPIDMGTLPVEAQRAEYVENLLALHRATDEWPRAMSHPSDSWDANTLEVLRDLGILLGFTATPAVWNEHPLCVPRRNSAELVQTVREGACVSSS